MSKLIFLKDNTIDYGYYTVALESRFKSIHLNYDEHSKKYTFGYRVELISENAAFAATKLAKKNNLNKVFIAGDSLTYLANPVIYLGFLDLMSENGLIQGVDYRALGKTFQGYEWWGEAGPCFISISNDGKYTTHTIISDQILIEELRHAISYRNYIESINDYHRYESGQFTIIEPKGSFRWEKYMISKSVDFMDPKNFNK